MGVWKGSEAIRTSNVSTKRSSIRIRATESSAEKPSPYADAKSTARCRMVEEGAGVCLDVWNDFCIEG